MAMIETLMEHVAMELDIPSLDIRLANMSQDQNETILKFISEFRQWSDYDNRLKGVEEFNKVNRIVYYGIYLLLIIFF